MFMFEKPDTIRIRVYLKKIVSCHVRVVSIRIATSTHTYMCMN